MPLANRNIRPDEIAEERRYPLVARVCGECLLVQVDDSVPPQAIFSDYDYFSSTSSSWVAHAEKYCAEMCSRFNVKRGSHVVEIASNDGYLLQNFKNVGASILGIEPAANVAAVAVSKGIKTEVAFFGHEVARNLAAREGKANLIVANNVLAHVPQIRDFTAGVAELLSYNGIATFEFPHILNLIDGIQFDTIYHEHFSYLSLFSVEKVLASVGLRVFDVKQLSTHGGSLRLYVCRDSADYQSARELPEVRAQESSRKIHLLEGYMDLTEGMNLIKSEFLRFLAGANREGKVVAAYGAAAKGNTFLNFCGVVHPMIEVVYDQAEAKQGKLTPGSHIPIRPPSRLKDLKPDYLLILPWNIADEIVQAQQIIRNWSGRFVTAIPTIRIF